MVERASRRSSVERREREPVPAAPFVRISEHTSTSPKHPEQNHDSKRSSATDGFAVISDGLGKSLNPHLASKKVTTVIAQRMREIGRNADVAMAAYAMRFAFDAANAAVQRDVPGGKATATAIKVVENDGKKYGVIGHVGDSRLGILRKDGTFRYITHDDTVAGQQGLSAAFDAIDKESQYDALHEDMKVLFDLKTKCTQKMGEPNTPHVYTVELQDGDRIVLHSDGVHDNLKTENVVACLKSKRKNKAKALTRKARTHSRKDEAFKAKGDDITVIVMDIIPQPTYVQEIVRFKGRKKLAKSGRK